MSKDRRTVHCVPGTTSHGRESLVHLVALGPKEAPEVISFLLSAILGSTCLLSSNDAISQTNSAFLLPKDMGSGPSLGQEERRGWQRAPHREDWVCGTCLSCEDCGATGDPDGLWDLFCRFASPAWVAPITESKSAL